MASVVEIRNSLVLQKIIRDELLAGRALSVDAAETLYNQYLEDHDTSKAIFKAADFSTVRDEVSSVVKQNTTDAQITQDLSVLYKALFDVSGDAIKQFERWKTEGRAVEARLRTLRENLLSLLLGEEEIEGYFGYVEDPFSDLSRVDIVRTSTGLYVDTLVGMVGIRPQLLDANDATRLNLAHLRREDAQFTVLSRRSLQAVVEAPDGGLLHAFDDRNNFWQHRVYVTDNRQPVVAELKVRLHLADLQSFNRISFRMHAIASGSGMTVTPMLSKDGVNFTALPIDGATRDVRESTLWAFPMQEARWVKFILAKAGHDTVDGSLYVYEFGAEDISFYDEAYPTGTTFSLVSLPLGLSDGRGAQVEFSRLLLETCDHFPSADTSILYFVQVGSQSDFVPSATGWLSISPSNRASPLHPTIVEAGDLSTIHVDDVSLSYSSAVATPTTERSPALLFNLMDDAGTVSPVTASAVGRYILQHQEEKILNLQFSVDLPTIPTLLGETVNPLIRRNIGAVGVTTTVRGAQRGWRFEDPYYATVGEVRSPPGFTIDWGDSPVIINDVSRTGRVILPPGNHRIKVHKDNWINIPSGATTLVQFLERDPLYPYNHKHLVEGYTLDIEENPYGGFDTFCELLMERASPLEIIGSVASDDYKRYAIDLDTGDSANGRPASHVSLLKMDPSQADFINERFRISFRLTNQTFTHVRLRADFLTQDAALSPRLEKYRIRLGR